MDIECGSELLVMASGLVSGAPAIAESSSSSDWTKSDRYTFFMTAEELGAYYAAVRERCEAVEESMAKRGYHRGRRGKALSEDND